MQYQGNFKICLISQFENNQCLLKCLKGDAREVPIDPPGQCGLRHWTTLLQIRRPEQLIQSQLRQIRELPYNLAKIITFTTKIKDLVVFLQSANSQQHITNPTLLKKSLWRCRWAKNWSWRKSHPAFNSTPRLWISVIGLTNMCNTRYGT